MNNLVMVYDTETTGKTDFKLPWNDDSQPNLVQIGYKVFTPKKEVVFEIGHLVNTTGFPQWNGIEPDAQDVHGISEELVREWGWNPQDTISLFQRWANRCNMFVAHNDEFDIRILQGFALRCGWSPDLFGTSMRFCTMRSTTNICKIPHPKTGRPKWPKLNEAYPFFFPGQQFKNAHNALADVNPTAEIFWKLVDAEIVQLPT